MALALALLSGNSCQTCPGSCPAASAGATFVVTTTSAEAASGVQVNLTGPMTGTMSCQPNFSAVLCEWPPGVAVVAGTYSLQIYAPGYQPTLAEVEVATPPPGACGCSADSITPSSVMISPADAATD